MITVDNVLHVSGIVLFVLISASFMTYTSKFIFREDRIKKPPDLVYDPDHGANVSAVCVFSKKLHSTTYEESPCHNRTLIHWYNPWLRHAFWKSLWNDINERRRLREVRLSQMRVVEKTEANTTLDPPVTLLPQKEAPEVQTTKKTTEKTEFIYSLLIGLLIISMLFAYWEVLKDRLKRNAAAGAKNQGQECTLADFTINRHRRRESQQQQCAANLPRQASFESTAKVTQTLIHQSSLDRAFPKTISEVVKSMNVRRSSVPTSLDNEVLISVKSQSVATKTLRQSVDLSGEEINTDLRRKSRHLIRRH